MKHQSGEAISIPSTDTILQSNVPGRVLMMKDNDIEAAVSRTDDRDISIPVIQERGRDSGMEEDIQLLPTSSERVSTGREDPTKEVISTDTEVRRCSYNKVGRCKLHGDGARRVFKMVSVPVEGEDGVKTTRVQKKYIWR